MLGSLGKLLCQDTVPASGLKNQGWEQPTPDHITLPPCRPVGKVWGYAKLGQFTTLSGRSLNKDGVQNSPSWAATPDSSHCGWDWGTGCCRVNCSIHYRRLTLEADRAEPSYTTQWQLVPTAQVRPVCALGRAMQVSLLGQHFYW